MDETCAKCNEIGTDGVRCQQCGFNHFKCAGVCEADFRSWDAETRTAWRCGPCHLPATTEDISLATILHELRETRKDLKEIMQVKVDITEKLSSFDQRLKTIEPLKSQYNDLNAVVQKMSSTISILQNKLEVKEQQDRINNLEISGVPVINSENVYIILQKLCVKVGFCLLAGDVDFIHRVRRYPAAASQNHAEGEQMALVPNIIVCFTQRRRKDELLSAVRARRGLNTADLDIEGPVKSIYVSEHLSPANKLLLRKARDICSEHGFKYIWVRECKILVRRNDTSKAILISGESDLVKIKND